MKETIYKKRKTSLNMRSIFRCMMEGGYYPIYEKPHIIFGLDENLCVVEYEEGILSIRLFFSIEEDNYHIFLEASNEAMLKTFVVKPVVLDDMKNLMFSCELPCDNIREFRKFFPRSIELLRETLKQHKKEMKKLLLAEEIFSKAIPTTDGNSSMAGITNIHKVLS